jgi:hypothetical protein
VVCATHDINLLSELKGPERVRVLGLKEGRRLFEMPLSDQTLCEALGELFGIEFVRLPVLETGPNKTERFFYLPKPGAFRSDD